MDFNYQTLEKRIENVNFGDSRFKKDFEEGDKD
jgi:hypothetical protein